MTRLLITSVCLLFSTAGFCKTIVVSDIDDTIRSFHSGSNYFEMLDNASDPERAFRGMSEIYNDLDRAGAEIHYVTAAVQPFVGMSQDFLETNYFPQSEHYTNKGWFEDTIDFKVASIQTILAAATSADVIILLGDNGDHDVEVYRQIAQQFPQAQVFIHKLFPAPLESGQNFYLTGADLAVSLEARGLLTSDDVDHVLKNLLSDLSAKDPFIFDMIWPSWGETTPHDVEAVFSVPSEHQQDLAAIKAAVF